MSATVTRSSNFNVVAYGSKSENVEIPIVMNRDPLIHDINFPIGKRWINTLQNNVFSLLSFEFHGLLKTANWSNLVNPTFVASAGGASVALQGSPLTVMNSACTTLSFILIARNFINGSIGPYAVPTSGIHNGSFIINPSNGGDTSNLYYVIINASAP